MDREFMFRIVLEKPPASVDFGLQKGRVAITRSWELEGWRTQLWNGEAIRRMEVSAVGRVCDDTARDAIALAGRVWPFKATSAKRAAALVLQVLQLQRSDVREVA